MKIFISWSGQLSKKIACELHEWLPFVIQGVKPFMSSEDIKIGQRWSDSIADELENTACGIICLTPYNLKSPWLNFEAGALSKATTHSFLSPFLFKIDPNKVPGPLSQFQSTTNDEESVRHLIMSINNLLGDNKISEEILYKTFGKWWPELKNKLSKIDKEYSEGKSPVESSTGYSWLYPDEDLIKIEEFSNCNSIWVITPTPEQDLRQAKLNHLLETHLENKIIHTIIAPLSETKEIERGHNTTFARYKKIIKLAGIHDEEFHRQALSHYIIINPDESGTYVRRAFFELPTSEKGYWIEIEGNAASDLVDRFQRLIDKINGGHKDKQVLDSPETALTSKVKNQKHGSKPSGN